jgi:hypothetical protein
MPVHWHTPDGDYYAHSVSGISRTSFLPRAAGTKVKHSCDAAARSMSPYAHDSVVRQSSVGASIGGARQSDMARAHIGRRESR